MLRRDRKALRKGADPADLAAARILREAGGECARCGHEGAPLVAVPGPTGFLHAECLNRAACDARVEAHFAGRAGR